MLTVGVSGPLALFTIHPPPPERAVFGGATAHSQVVQMPVLNRTLKPFRGTIPNRLILKAFGPVKVWASFGPAYHQAYAEVPIWSANPQASGSLEIV